MGFPRNRVPSNLTVLWMGQHSQQRIPRGPAPKENHGAAIHNNAGKQHGQRLSFVAARTSMSWVIKLQLDGAWKLHFSICCASQFGALLDLCAPGVESIIMQTLPSSQVYHHFHQQNGYFGIYHILFSNTANRMQTVDPCHRDQLRRAKRAIKKELRGMVGCSEGRLWWLSCILMYFWCILCQDQCPGCHDRPRFWSLAILSTLRPGRLRHPRGPRLRQPFHASWNCKDRQAQQEEEVLLQAGWKSLFPFLQGSTATDMVPIDKDWGDVSIMYPRTFSMGKHMFETMGFYVSNFGTTPWNLLQRQALKDEQIRRERGCRCHGNGTKSNWWSFHLWDGWPQVSNSCKPSVQTKSKTQIQNKKQQSLLQAASCIRIQKFAVKGPWNY